MKYLQTLAYTVLMLATTLPLRHTGFSSETKTERQHPAAFMSIGTSMQLWEGLTNIYQRGVLVGQVWTPARDVQACQYMEYWWLGPGYQYPSARYGGGFKLETIPGSRFDGSLDEFRSAMQAQFGGGYLVNVSSYEERPGCPVPPLEPAN